MSRLRGNSLGGITKVKDGRKKPYRVRVTVSCSYDEEAGKMKQEVKTLGYFKTRAEAEKALCDYIESPYDLSSKVMTFKELYEKWSEAYFPTLSGESSIRTITSAYKYCEGLSNLLGWGEKTITRYERHQVQNMAHDAVLRKISSDPAWLLELLE